MNSSSEFQTEFCRIVSLCIVNVRNVWKWIQRLRKTHDLIIYMCGCAFVCGCARAHVLHLSSSRVQAQCQAAS